MRSTAAAQQHGDPAANGIRMGQAVAGARQGVDWPTSAAAPAMCRLYERCGFAADAGWVDPRWLRSAEGGKADVERRYLLTKALPPAEPPGVV